MSAQGSSEDAPPLLRVLGPLEVGGAEGPVPVRPGRPTRLLAALAIRLGSPVEADALVELLWPERPPKDARNALQVLVSSLRKQLDPLAGRLAVDWGAGGYRLVASDPSVVDAVRFEAGVRAASLPGQGRDGPAGTGPAGASAADLTAAWAEVERALALWRGTPYADIADTGFARGEVVRLDELRAQAEERRAALLLALGRADAAAIVLRQHVGENPLREGAWALLMVALYRSGRQGDALRAYGTVREHLVEELGIEPGAELQSLEKRVLDHDPALDWSPPGPAPAGPGHGDAATAAVGDDGGLGPLPSRVPEPVAPLVGRAFEVGEVRAALAERRLVTLVGPAGVGKTRLAVEAARAFGRDHSVLVVELSALEDAGALPALLAAEVGVPAVPGRDPLEAVAARLAAQPALLVLDTCEHVVDAVARAASFLLRRAPGLRVLATSRQPLDIEGEVAWRVPPLELADEGAVTLVDVEPSGAVRLFVDRARAVRSDFALTDDNAADVAAICRTLDGLPLAISLAASRTNLLSPAGILARLDDRFALLSRGGRDAERRQRSLRAAVEWSYDLLGQDERRLFRRLGAFPASFDLAAAAAVAGDPGDDVFEGLGDLVDRSLVVARDDRFVLLDTLRAFAADLLAGEPGEAAAVRGRHAAWYAAIALAADPVSHGPLPGRSTVLRQEWVNVLAALEWSFAVGRPADGARLAGAVAGFLVLEGRLVQADHWLTRARAVDADDATTASVYRGVGMLDLYRSRYPEARMACDHAVGAARRTGDDRLVGSTLLALGTAEWGLGEYDRARLHLTEAADLFARVGDDRGRGFALSRLGRTLATVREETALATLEAGERLLAAVEGEWMHAAALEHLAGGLLMARRADEAVERAGGAVALARTVGSHVGELAAVLTLGRARRAAGDPVGAARAHRSALAQAIGMTNPGGTAEALDALADDCDGDRPELAAELRGCAAAVRDEHRVTLAPGTARRREVAVARSRARLGPGRIAACERSGRARPPAWALEALADPA